MYIQERTLQVWRYRQNAEVGTHITTSDVVRVFGVV